MNVMLRMLLPLGLIGFGAVAAFMGLVVLATSLRSGEITTGMAASGGRPASLSTVSRASDRDGFWRSLMLLGVLPGLGGLAAIWAGRRMLSRP